MSRALPSVLSYNPTGQQALALARWPTGWLLVGRIQGVRCGRVTICPVFEAPKPVITLQYFMDWTDFMLCSCSCVSKSTRDNAIHQTLTHGGALQLEMVAMLADAMDRTLVLPDHTATFIVNMEGNVSISDFYDTGRLNGWVPVISMQEYMDIR